MEPSLFKRSRRLASLVAAILFLSCSVTSLAQTAPAPSTVCKECLQKDVTYLASDELRGRGSATPDELTAANYIAGVFKKLGLEPPAGGNYILPVALELGKFTAPPKLKFTTNGKETVWTHGNEMLSPHLFRPELKGKLVHAKADPAAATTIPEGAVVVIADEIPDKETRKVLMPFFSSKAVAVIFRAAGPYLHNWDRFASEPAELPAKVEGEPSDRNRVAMIAVKANLISALAQAPDGTEISISGPTADANQQTRNVVGILRGSDPKLKDEYVMFSAHMDHLGVCGKTGDTICNGADDDASGTATVLELARIFSSGPRPKRSVVFTTYGSEELGLLGSRGFAAKPPVPLTDIAADIEFEQTGLPESKVGGNGFWMTGSSFSDLGSLLTQHGSKLADDPFPGSPFFRQSDNYSLAAKGVVAHTMSGAAEFADYHRPGDEVQKLNFSFMAQSIQSVLPGLEWLINTDTRPKYFPGKNPAEKQ